MYRLLVIMMSAVLIAGCGNLKTNDFLSRTGDALSKIGQRSPAVDPDQKIKPLFDQPYIDPLTDYLQRYGDDPARTDQVVQVRQERERRCAAVARRYNSDGITETGLALYRRGYDFSCPQDVAAYKARLEAIPQAPIPPQQPVIEPASDNSEVHDDEAQGVVVSRQLNDCYLLTRIRNFSGALKACRGPAEDGAVGAQASMAQIQSALGNHEAGYRWARQAAPESGQAAYLLGEMYAQGLGVAQDKEAAANWFKTAVRLGYAGAENALDNLATATADTNAN
ncbi:hypothetical protein LCGC14_1033650 [marine sediment metagenome]|uniref:Sel1 repeat family protein n=2 Tax=root TaxID=1 RepID=A0A831R6I9_9GAMM|nr:hypothetical protein [Marinobacter antarcticus]HEA53738.1 sel1 repeat family protein [Marinobacter antarcticus]